MPKPMTPADGTALAGQAVRLALRELDAGRTPHDAFRAEIIKQMNETYGDRLADMVGSLATLSVSLAALTAVLIKAVEANSDFTRADLVDAIGMLELEMSAAQAAYLAQIEQIEET